MDAALPKLNAAGAAEIDADAALLLVAPKLKRGTLVEEAAAADDEAFGPPKLNSEEVFAAAEEVEPPNAKDGAVAVGASADAVPPKEKRGDLPASSGPPNANAVEDGAATAGFTAAVEESGNPKDAVLLSFPLPLD